MARDYTVKMSVEDNISGTVRQAKQAVTDFTAQAEKLETINQRFDRLQRGTVPLRRQLRELQQIMADMNFNGLQNTQEFTRIAEYAGTVADAMGDARQAVNAFANDTMKLQATAQAFQLVAGGASIVTGTMGLLGIESDKVQEMMLKVQSALALVNGVQAIANLLNKDSALMLRLKQIRLQAQTKATVADTVAEKANNVVTTQNTVAQVANTASIKTNTTATVKNTATKKAWNTVTAISKALMGDWTGLILVGATALLTYSLATTKSKEETEKQNEATKRLQERQEAYNSTYASSASQLITKYNKLKREWTSLTTTMEKNKFLKDNITGFNELGMAINGIADADKFFIQNTDKVIEALEARAKALGITNAIQTVNDQYYQNLVTPKFKVGDKLDKGDPIHKQIMDFMDKMASESQYKGGKLKDQTAVNIANRLYSKYMQPEWEKERDNQMKMLNSSLDEAEQTILKNGLNFNSPNTQTQTTEISRDLSSKLNKLKKEYSDDLIDYDTFKQKLQKLSEEFEKNKFKPIDVDLEITKATEDKLTKSIQNIVDRYSRDLISRDLASELIESLNKEAKGKTETFFDTNAILEKVDIDKIMEEFNFQKVYRDNGGQMGIFTSVLQDLINRLKKGAEELEKLNNPEIELPTEELEEGAEKVDDYYISFERLSAINKIYKAGLDDIIAEQKELTYAFQNGLISETQFVDGMESCNEEIEDLGGQISAINPRNEALRKSISDLNKEYSEFIFTVQHGGYELDEIMEKYDEFRDKANSLGEDLEPPIDLNMYMKADEAVRKLLGDMDFKSNALSDAKGIFGTLQDQLKLGMIDKSQVKEVIDKINEYLQSIGLEPLVVTIDAEGNITEFNDKMKEIQDTLKGMRGTTGQIYDDFKQLGEIFQYNANAGQKAGAMLSTVGQNLNQIAGDGALAKAGAIAAAIGQLALTFATSLSKTSSPWEWIAASLAGVATMAGVITQIKGFSQGGIVAGSSLVGDRILAGNARVNSGEMILNGSQQKKLFNMLDSNGVGITNSLKQVEFVIDGKVMRGVLKNYNDRMTKLK